MPRDAKLIILVYFNRQPREMTNMALPFLFLNDCAARFLQSRCSARRRATVIEGRSRRGRTSLRAPPPWKDVAAAVCGRRAAVNLYLFNLILPTP